MAKAEERPVDTGVADLRGGDEAAAVEWWKKRVALLAAIPSDIARAGAIVPLMRELSRLPADERRRLIRARIRAVVAAPADQRDKVLAAVRLAGAIDPALVQSDQELARQLVAEVPGAEELTRQPEQG